MFSTKNKQNTNIFIFLHQNQVKFNQIRLNYTKVARNTTRLGGLSLIEFLCLTQSGIFLAPSTPNTTDRYAVSTKQDCHKPNQEQHQTQVYKSNYI